MLLAAAGSEGPKPKPRSFPDPAVSIPVLVVVSPPFINKATFAQSKDESGGNTVVCSVWGIGEVVAQKCVGKNAGIYFT